MAFGYAGHIVRYVRGGWKRRFLPLWVVLAFALLGLIYLVTYPLGWRDWSAYAFAILVTTLYGFLIRRRYRSTLLEFSETETEWIYVYKQVWRRPWWSKQRRTAVEPASPPPSSPGVGSSIVSSGRIVLPPGIAQQPTEAMSTAPAPPPSRRSRIFFWVGAGSLLLSVIIVGGLGAVIALVGGMTEWQRAKRDGEDETRRKSLQACVLGGLGCVVTVVALILY